MPQPSPLSSLTAVRSQLAEQMIAWLENTRDYPDHEAMPGRTIKLPLYYDAELGRTPGKLYIPPVVGKAVPKRVTTSDRDGESKDDDQRPRHREFGSVAEDLHRENGSFRVTGPDREPVAWEQEVGIAPPGARYLVFGAPGQGKSWLSQNTAGQLATQALDALHSRTRRVDDLVVPVCDRVDQFIGRCAEFAGTGPIREQHVEDAISLLFASFIHCHVGPEHDHAEVQTPHLAEHLARHLREGRFWLFLDALDEYDADDADIRLGQFFTAIAHWQTRVVVTARDYAEERFTLAVPNQPGVATYRLEELRPRDVEAFVDRWFNPAAPQPHTPIKPRLRQGQFAAIAQSPSLLTLLCVLASDSKAEPLGDCVTRSQLFTRMLKWLFRYSGQNNAPPTAFDDTEGELEKIAKAMVNGSSVNCSTASKPRIARRDLRDIIRGPKKAPRSEKEIDQRLELYKQLRLLAPEKHHSDSNWVFNHNEFAAFFAGRCYARRHNQRFKPKRTKPQSRKVVATEKHLLHRIWQPAWERVAAFFVGHCEHPADFLKALRDPQVYDENDHPFGEDLLRYRLCVGARMLAELDPGLYQRSAKHKKRYETEIEAVAEAALNFWFDEFRHFGRFPWTYTAQGVLTSLLNNLTQATTSAANNPILRLAKIIKSRHLDSEVRAWAATTLGTLSAQTGSQVQQQAIDTLLGFINDRDIDSGVRGRMATALGALGAQANPQIRREAIGALLEFVKAPDVDSWARAEATTGLGTFGAQADPQGRRQAIDALLGFTKDPDIDSGVRGRAATALGTLGAQADLKSWREALNALLGFIKDPGIGSWARAEVATTLGTLGAQADPQTRRETMEVLRDFIGRPNIASGVRVLATPALGTLGAQADPQTRREVIDVLLGFIKDPDIGSWARAEAAPAFETLGAHADPQARREALDALLSVIKDPDIENKGRAHAASALGTLGAQADPQAQREALDDLLGVIKDPDIDRWLRAEAASALDQLIQKGLRLIQGPNQDLQICYPPRQLTDTLEE